MGIEDRIVAKLNAELGGSVDNISRSKDLVNKYVNQLNIIEEKVKKLFLCFLKINLKFFFSAKHK